MKYNTGTLSCCRIRTVEALLLDANDELLVLAEDVVTEKKTHEQDRKIQYTPYRHIAMPELKSLEPIVFRCLSF